MAIDDELTAHIEAVTATVAGSSGLIDEIVGVLTTCFERGGKLLICGNGGSAADSQHLAAEFMNRMRTDSAAVASDRADHRHLGPHVDRQRRPIRGRIRPAG